MAISELLLPTTIVFPLYKAMPFSSCESKKGEDSLRNTVLINSEANRYFVST